MRYIKYLLISFIILLFFTGCTKNYEKDLPPGIYARMNTDKGTFIIELEYKKVPMLVANFIGLAEGIFTAAIEKDAGYYDNTRFFDVTDNALIKGGKPWGTGKIESHYYLPTNFNPGLLHDREGAISMLKTESGIHGSQFSITLKKMAWLDYNQPVFGYVISGIENLKTIRAGDILRKATIVRIGEEAVDFIVTPEYFNELKNSVEKENWETAKTRNEEVISQLKKRWPDLVQTRSGIYFTILRQGAGLPPDMGTKIMVKYTGTLPDGTVFIDTAGEEGGVKKMIAGEAIKGLKEALLTMRKGEQRIVVIPPEMGFGEAGLSPLIPPNAFLIFDIELIDF
ncbi:MAG: peptidylprolyl isomerase [Spirochaetales bacterium]|nr:peptidylprolyl isomerase [Spirochaetales bacterium]